MNYWLIKSEPFVYSFDQLIADGKTDWTGVRNYQARNNLKAMAKGDICFYYHSNEGMEIVGSAKVSKTFFQDPTTDDKNWVAVEVVPHKKFKKTIPLQTFKEDKRFAEMVLVKNSRLSVQPVTAEEAKLIEALSK
jgi:predicted RNA-binding protein with PUA-like domain